jgi:hypothetical protein
MNLLQAAAIPFILVVYGGPTKNTAQAEPRRHREDAKSAKVVFFAVFASLRCKIITVLAIHE